MLLLYYLSILVGVALMTYDITRVHTLMIHQTKAVAVAAPEQANGRGQTATEPSVSAIFSDLFNKPAPWIKNASS